MKACVHNGSHLVFLICQMRQLEYKMRKVEAVEGYEVGTSFLINGKWGKLPKMLCKEIFYLYSNYIYINHFKKPSISNLYVRQTKIRWKMRLNSITCNLGCMLSYMCPSNINMFIFLLSFAFLYSLLGLRLNAFLHFKVSWAFISLLWYCFLLVWV